MKKGQKVTLGALVVVAALIYLMISGFSGNTGFEVALSELVDNGSQFGDQYILTEGYLVEGSDEWNGEKIELKFSVKDEDGNQLPVVFNGVKPDNFHYEEAQLILKGSYDVKEGIFKAEKVETRCPTKYEQVEE